MLYNSNNTVLLLRHLLTFILLASTVSYGWEGDVNRDDLSYWVTENVRDDIPDPRAISHDINEPARPREEIEFNYTCKHRGVISLKLVRIDGEPEAIYEETKNVSEGTHIHWVIELPSENPAIYGFGALLYEAVRNRTHPFIVKIVVPAQKLTAEWSLDKEEYHYGEHPIWTLTNLGITRVIFENVYWYEKKVDDRWVQVPGERTWVSLEFSAEPKSTRNERLDLFMVTSGDYRFCKEIEIMGTDVKETIHIEFTFTENPWRVSRFIIPVAVIICVSVLFYRRRNRAYAN